MKIGAEDLRRVRGGKIGFVFQDPMTSLNPVYTVGMQIMEPLRKHMGLRKAAARARAQELLELVGIADAERRLKDYPHQFSGGMRQRVMIAIALACDPQVLIADEPTTALDVTIQAQILELMKDLQDRLGMAVIWITHDLVVVAGIADRVVVMYGGQIVEQALTRALFKNPQHPYTCALLKTVPSVRGEREDRLAIIEGQPPILGAQPSACPFRDRCDIAMERCAQENPPRYDVGGGHDAACLYDANIGGGHAVFDAPKTDKKLVEVSDLKMHFPIYTGLFRRHTGDVKAVDGVSFDIYEDETLGLVGESGCGKSTCGRAVLRLYDITDGSIVMDGIEIGATSQAAFDPCVPPCKWCFKIRKPPSIRA